jgi:type II secretory pathway component PulF
MKTESTETIQPIFMIAILIVMFLFFWQMVYPKVVNTFAEAQQSKKVLKVRL